MRKNLKQNIIIVVGSIMVIVMSTLMTITLTKNFTPFTNENDVPFQNVTFTDATLTCEKKVINEFGARLAQKVVDRHSSRFEHQSGLYKIFLSAYVEHNYVRTEYYVSCFVRSKNGRVSKFEVFENVNDTQSEPIKRNSDKLLIWPE